MADSNENTALVSVLRDAHSPELERRRAAEAQLSAAEKDNFPEYLRALTRLLATENDDHVRQLAGLLVKNAVSGVDMKIDCLKRQKWLEVPPQVANEIKMALIATLDSPCLAARNSASQAISKIARVEIPCGNWPTLVPTLELLSQQGGPTHRRIGAYQVIGYFCEDVQSLREEIGREILEPQMKEVLLKCLSVGLVDQDLDVRLAALKAFYYGVFFAEQYVANEPDRSALYGVLGGCLNAGREDVELAAWEVWLQLASEFYSELAPAMPELHDISLSRIAAGCDTSPTALSAIEFWSTLCDEEILIMEGDGHRNSMQYIKRFQETLMPALYEATTKQEYEDLEDEWTVAMAAGTSIGLCAQILKDEILGSALTFIEANFGALEWNRREAAVLVYGSILEGPSPTGFSDLLQKSFEPLCKRLSDDSPAVRDTTAWTIGRLARYHYSAISNYIEPVQNPGLISLLVNRLPDQPRVAANICFALYEICAGINSTPSHEPGTSRIDPYFITLADALVGVAKRPDANEHRLRNAAHHALYMLVKQVGDGAAQEQNLRILMTQLMDWMELTLRQGPSEEMAEVQGPMCGCLNALIGRLDKAVLPDADRLYSIFQRTVQSQSRAVNLGETQWNTAAEEALLALNKLISAMQQSFDRYMSNFYHLIHAVLKTKEDSDFVAIAIDVVGNLATSMGDQFAPYVSTFAPELFSVLRDANTPIFLKPKAITALGDIAVMAPQAFLPYLKEFMEILHQAAGARLNQGPLESDEWVKYISDLRDATLTSYVTVIFSIRDISTPNTAQQQYNPNEPTPQTMLETEVHTMLELVTAILSESKIDHRNLKNALHLIMDLVNHFRTNFVQHMRALPMARILRERCMASDDPDVKQLFLQLEDVSSRNF